MMNCCETRWAYFIRLCRAYEDATDKKLHPQTDWTEYNKALDDYRTHYMFGGCCCTYRYLHDGFQMIVQHKHEVHKQRL